VYKSPPPEIEHLPPLGKPGYTPQYTPPSSGSTDHSGSRRAICTGECGQKCSMLSSQAAIDDCRREVRNCQAQCR
jgi:hypothetical protein